MVGIYALGWPNQGLIYIGHSSINTMAVAERHLIDLEKGLGPSDKINQAYASYGKPEYIELEDCSNNPKVLRAKHHHWMRHYNYEVLNNYTSRSTKVSRLKAFSFLSRTRMSLEEVSEKSGLSLDEVTGILDGTKLKFLEREYPYRYFCMKMRDSIPYTPEHHKASDSKMKVLKAFYRLLDTNQPYRQIAEDTGINISRLSAIVHNKSECWLKLSFPEEFDRMNLKRATKECLYIRRKDTKEVYEIDVISKFVRMNKELFSEYASEKSAINSLSKLKNGTIKSTKHWSLVEVGSPDPEIITGEDWYDL